jgi:hypothetical protein
LRICATHTWQILNYSSIAKAVGISASTGKSWLGILEQSYLVFRLPPFFRDLGKRLIKSPKLYFYDTGLLCHLLGVLDADFVKKSDLKGGLFEDLVVADAFKSFYHQGIRPAFYFYRNQQKKEVDLLYEHALEVKLWEIKATDRCKPRLLDQLEKVADFWDRPAVTNLVYSGDEEHQFRKSTLINGRSLKWDQR